MGKAENVKVGVGKLFTAIVGSTEPTDLATAWSAAWIPLGYTDEGSEFSSTPEWDEVRVAEEDEPVRRVITGRSSTLEFNAAELTAANIQKALNGGTITTAASVITFNPPAPGAAPVRIAIGWESNEGDERLIFRKCVNTGALTLTRRRGAEKTSIPFSFALEVVSGKTPWTRISNYEVTTV